MIISFSVKYKKFGLDMLYDLKTSQAAVNDMKYKPGDACLYLLMSYYS